jgi:hypothetical protein
VKNIKGGKLRFLPCLFHGRKMIGQVHWYVRIYLHFVEKSFHEMK